MRILLLTSLLFLVACAHNIEKSLKDVRPGMTRSDVVDELGSPLYVDRKSSERHVWVYRYYDEKAQQWVRKGVFFENDIVSKVDLAPKRGVVLKNDNVEPLDLEAAKPPTRIKGSIKDQPGVGSEDWYQDIKSLEKEQLQMEKSKTVPKFQNIN